MKIIFDFDDVLFKNTALFKEHIFSVIEKYGVSQDMSREKYRLIRETNIPFSLKDFLHSLDIDTAYNDIMSPHIKNFLNQELAEIARTQGKENCYLVTNGEEGFQKEKIILTEISGLFKEIYYVPQTKKQIIEKICQENIGEKILFIEDRERFIRDLDMTICANLRIILFTQEVGLQRVREAL